MRHGLYLLLALASLAGCSENSVKSLEPAAEEWKSSMLPLHQGRYTRYLNISFKY